MDNMLIFWITLFCAGFLVQSADMNKNVWHQNDKMFNAHLKIFTNDGAQRDLTNLKHTREIADLNSGISKFHFNINERYEDASNSLSVQDRKNIFDSASSTIESQVKIPNYDDFIGQQNYFVSQSNAAPNRNNFRAALKPLFIPYSKTSRSSPAVPVYKPLQYYSHQTSSSHNQQNIAKPSYRSLPNNNNYYTSNLDNVRSNPEFYGSLNNHNKNFQHLDRDFYDNIHITTNSPLQLPKTKVVRALTNLLGTENFQNNMQSLEINPSILSAESGLQYRTEPGISKAHDFRYQKPNIKNQKVNFFSYKNPLYTNSIKILPLQTNNASQLTKYKGAAVKTYSNRALSKFPNEYEEFKLQPLLHFINKGNNSPIPFNDLQKKNNYKSRKIKPGIDIAANSNPTSKIKEEDDENSYEESNNENKNIDSYLPRDEDDTGDEPGKYFGEPEFESNFEPSKTHIFKHYEEDFQNNNKPLNVAYHKDDINDNNYQVNLAAKFRYNISENENDYDIEDVNEKSKKIIKPESQDDFSSQYSEEEEDNTEEKKKEENNSNSSLEKISHETENNYSKFPVRTYADNFYKNYKAKSKQNQPSKTSKSSESRSYNSFHKVDSSLRTARKKSRPSYQKKLSDSTSSFSLESPFQSSDFDFPILKDNSFNSQKNTSLYTHKTKWGKDGNKRQKNSRYTSEDLAREKSSEKSVLENLETFDY